jgi:hypothetical protein
MSKFMVKSPAIPWPNYASSVEIVLHNRLAELRGQQHPFLQPGARFAAHLLMCFVYECQTVTYQLSGNWQKV